MRTAFKEWAVIVDALGRGSQILILRKGGISEGKGGFKLNHEKFWLFPTLFHQQRESVLPAAQARYDKIAPQFPPANILRLHYFAETVWSGRLESRDAVARLRGSHVWRDEVISERFEWGREQVIFALAVRVHQLAKAIELPLRESYGGCKSWIELDEAVATADSQPVLTNAQFEAKLTALKSVSAAEITTASP